MYIYKSILLICFLCFSNKLDSGKLKVDPNCVFTWIIQVWNITKYLTGKIVVGEKNLAALV